MDDLAVALHKLGRKVSIEELTPEQRARASERLSSSREQVLRAGQLPPRKQPKQRVREEIE